MSKIKINERNYFDVKGSYFENEKELFEALLKSAKDANFKLDLTKDIKDQKVYSHEVNVDLPDSYRISIDFSNRFNSINTEVVVEGSVPIPKEVMEEIKILLVELKAFEDEFKANNYLKKQEDINDKYLINFPYETKFALDVIEDVFGGVLDRKLSMSDFSKQTIITGFKLKVDDCDFHDHHLICSIDEDVFLVHESSYAPGNTQIAIARLAKGLMNNNPSSDITREREMEFSHVGFTLKGKMRDSELSCFNILKNELGAFGPIIKADSNSFKIIIDNETYPNYETVLFVEKIPQEENSEYFRGRYFMIGPLSFDKNMLIVVEEINKSVTTVTNGFKSTYMFSDEDLDAEEKKRIDDLLPLNHTGVKEIDLKGNHADFIEFLEVHDVLDSNFAIDFDHKLNFYSATLRVNDNYVSLTAYPGVIKYYCSQAKDIEFINVVTELVEEFNALRV
jgi:hypothetical protein